jgi:hypothetical protein
VCSFSSGGENVDGEAGEVHVTRTTAFADNRLVGVLMVDTGLSSLGLRAKLVRERNSPRTVPPSVPHAGFGPSVGTRLGQNVKKSYSRASHHAHRSCLSLSRMTVQ